MAALPCQISVIANLRPYISPPRDLRLATVCSKANAEPYSPLPVISSLRSSKILRLEIIHIIYNMKECGKRIRQLRMRNGYTQEEVSQALNIDRSFYGHIESVQKGCSVDILVRLSDFFKVSLDYLDLGKKQKTFELNEKKAIKADITQLINRLDAFLTKL